MTFRAPLAALLLVLSGCRADGAGVDSSGLADDSSHLEGAGTCVRAPKAANRARKIVVSHPQGSATNVFEVLDLSATGAVTRPGVKFQMGTVTEEPIVFTPDGEIGLVPQDDGTIGVFRFDDAGAPHVVQAAFAGGFWATAITMSPQGDRAFVLDGDTADHGGGVYEVAIGCDGSLTSRGLAFPSGAPSVMTFLTQNHDRAVLVAGQAFSSTTDNDAFMVDLRGPSLVAQGSAFGDVNGDRSAMDVTPDGKYALVGDDDIRAGNRLAVVALPSMKQKQILTVDSPFSIVASPFGNAAIVVDGDDFNEITVLRYNPANTSEPITVKGPLAYQFPDPVLPGVAAPITRGQLTGRVLVAELSAIRQLQFTASGAVEDLAQTTFSDSNDDALGTLGVQP